MSENRVPGADDFLPVLIYVTIKASSHWLILLSCIPTSSSSNCSGDRKNSSQKQLTISQTLPLPRARMGPLLALDETAASLNPLTQMRNKVKQNEPSPTLDEIMGLASQSDPRPSQGTQDNESPINGGLRYPFMEAEAGELTIGDVEKLLSLYKDVVNKYTSLSRAVRHLAMPKTEPSVPHLKGINVQLEQPEQQLKKDHNMGE